MNKSLALKRKLYLFSSLVLTFFLFLYLFYFLINGDRGIIAYIKIKNLQHNYQNTLAILNIKNDFYNDRVKRLQPDTIDLDFLDEKLRQNTGFIEENEFLVFFED